MISMSDIKENLDKNNKLSPSDLERVKNIL